MDPSVKLWNKRYLAGDHRSLHRRVPGLRFNCAKIFCRFRNVTYARRVRNETTERVVSQFERCLAKGERWERVSCPFNRSKAIRQRMPGLVKHDVVRARHGHHDHESVPVILNFTVELRSFALQFSDRL
jgi:hypothetical protein